MMTMFKCFSGKSNKQEGLPDKQHSDQPTFEGALVGFGDRTEEETKAVLKEIAYILNHSTQDDSG